MSASEHLSPQQFVWHSSESSTWDPQGFVHAGTKSAALERARNLSKSSGIGRAYLHRLQVSAPYYPEVVPDKYANFASGNKDWQRGEVYSDLRADQDIHGSPPGNRVLGDIGKALRGGRVIRYRNQAEDPGSTSVVGDGSLFRHVGMERIR